MSNQFDAIKKLIESQSGPENQKMAVLAGLAILEQFLADLKRSADALETLAINSTVATNEYLK